MKQYVGLALGMVAGSVLGAAAVTSLNAQVKAPAVYLVTEIDVTNPEGYGKEFAPKAQATIKAAGGRLVAIGGAGGAGAKPVLAIEGTAPKRIVIQGWDSIDKLSPGITARTTRQRSRLVNNMQHSAELRSRQPSDRN